MKYSFLFFILFLASCTENFNNQQTKKPFLSKGFAYVYNENDKVNGIINKKMDNKTFQAAHNRLRPGTLIKITNVKNNETVILKINKRFRYPDFYKILITEPVAKKLKLNKKSPLVEIIEIKKNKSFIAKKTKIYKEEQQIHNNAPVTSVKIDNISKVKKQNKIINESYFIVIGNFYSKSSAELLKKRIKAELNVFDVKKLLIKSSKHNKITLLSGPYNSINLMKNDYIHLKNFGFEELDISINE